MEVISYGIKKKTWIVIGIVFLLVVSLSAYAFKETTFIENIFSQSNLGLTSAVGITNNNSIGYEYLESDILHFWNDVDDYYLNLSSGIQFSNHHEEYWTHNIYCAGYKTTEWNYLCNDDLPIQLNVYSDNETYN